MDVPFPVKEKLGEGAFGETYLIDYYGKEAVLKWPKQNNKESQVEVLI